MGCCWGRATERQAAPRAWRPLPGREDSSRGQIPHGLWAEVPVASVSLPVKREQGFPEVLLAFSVRCLLCFLCEGWSLSKSGPGGSAPPGPARPSQPRWRGPVQALACVPRPRAARRLLDSAQGPRLEALQWGLFTDLQSSGSGGSGAQGNYLLQNVLTSPWARPRHPALPPQPFFVLVSGTKSGVGQGSRWAYGPKPGHLSPPGMTKPQWRGLCLWPQLAPFWDSVGPPSVATANLPSLSSGPDLPGCILAMGP